MEAVATDAAGREFARQCEFTRQRRLAVMKRGVEARHLAHAGRGGADRPNGGDLVRLVQRGERHQLLPDPPAPARRSAPVASILPAVHHAVTDAVEAGLAANVACKPFLYRRDGAARGAGQGLVGELAALGVGDRQSRRSADPLDLTVHVLRQRAAGRGLEHRELDARGTGIDHQNRGLTHVNGLMMKGRPA